MNIKQITATIMQDFNKNYYKKMTATQENIDKLALDIDTYLKKVMLDGLLPNGDIAPVIIHDCGRGQLEVDIMHAFKHYSKQEQAKIYCHLMGIELHDVHRFHTCDEGYITGATLKSAVSRIYYEIEVE